MHYRQAIVLKKDALKDAITELLPFKISELQDLHRIFYELSSFIQLSILTGEAHRNPSTTPSELSKTALIVIQLPPTSLGFCKKLTLVENHRKHVFDES